ncbi:unnamed protein product [Pleuronectes platessa]|uniref:Uncharacterized protein n=1 Tax=Pleuronectes platessa TaxID=8262 RepID=A0A9N7TZ35_PLEPL|nr:unnamed protein product [Pleuronectes platessa]
MFTSPDTSSALITTNSLHIFVCVFIVLNENMFHSLDFHLKGLLPMSPASVRPARRPAVAVTSSGSSPLSRLLTQIQSDKFRDTNSARSWNTKTNRGEEFFNQ